MDQKTESQERLARPLIKLAKLSNVATSYTGQTGEFNEIDDDVIVQVLDALGINAATDEEIANSLNEIVKQGKTRLVSGTVFALLGEETKVIVHHLVGRIPQASIRLEDGTDYSGHIGVAEGDGSTAYPEGDSFYVSSSVLIPDDVPMGYHTLTVTAGEDSQKAALIVAPAKVPLPEGLVNGQMWGWMAQLYSIRSHASWGVGDFADLGLLLRDARAKTNADYMLINPVHAAEPVTPLTPSPYLPDSRRFVNFTYIRPEDVPEYAGLPEQSREKVEQLHQQTEALNANADFVNRDAMWQAKMPALWEVFSVPRSPEREAQFSAYKAEQGPDLDSYATWCVAYDKWGAPEDSPESWIKKYTIGSQEVRELVAENQDTFEFYRWLEWVADTQLAAAQQSAKNAGMPIGLMLDMAVGVHPLGSDVWAKPEQFAKGATVGAPPDFYNQQGQDWSQPPLNPLYLEKTGYRAYVDLIHHMFSGAGALRIDHILGLFRLWWIPEGNSAGQGTYVGYDSDIMLGILAIEATRANGVVIGEDLGVVPPYVASALSSHGLLGSVIEWFEKDEKGEFRAPSTYREFAMASVTTHDLPPTAGYLNYEHVQIRERLGLLAEPVEDFARAARVEHAALLRFLVEGGWLDEAALDDEQAHEQDIIEAMHKVLKDSKSKLLCAAIVDGVGERRSQNQPGTNNEYPNWRVPLADGEKRPLYAEELFDLPRVRSLGSLMDA